jgi:hypothetical protein
MQRRSCFSVESYIGVVMAMAESVLMGWRRDCCGGEKITSSWPCLATRFEFVLHVTSSISCFAVHQKTSSVVPDTKKHKCSSRFRVYIYAWVHRCSGVFFCVSGDERRDLGVNTIAWVQQRIWWNGSVMPIELNSCRQTRIMNALDTYELFCLSLTWMNCFV